MPNVSVKPEHILPIMIVMGVMFIGVCIALNLFSRARFQKQQTNAIALNSGRSTPVNKQTALKLRQYHANRRPSSSGRISVNREMSVRAHSAAGNCGLASDVNLNGLHKSRSPCSSQNSYMMREQTQSANLSNV